ncbi:MAG: hypothetical protein WCW44_03305 [archaeon]|jgi:hypothetical protein
MAKKKIKDMSEKDWEAWGKAFGKKMEKKGEKFGDKMEAWGESFGEDFECKANNFECHWSSKLGFFSILGPLFGSIFGIIFLIVTIFVLNVINIFIGSTFVSALTTFFSSNIVWFFVVSILLGYGKYLTKNIKLLRPILSPLVGTGGCIFTLWILGNIFLAINVSAKIAIIDTVANLLLTNLINIFIVFVVFAYMMQLLWIVVREIYW